LELASITLSSPGELPPLLVTGCAFDPLLDNGERLVASLREARATPRYPLWPGVTHACLHMTRMLDVAQSHIEDMAACVRARLSA
jgi:acetyl esterase